MKRIFKTTDNFAYFILRLTLAIVMFPHGAQKVLGWFGGMGYTATMQVFTTKMHMPYLMVLLLMAIEFLGSLSLIAGFLTRISALGIGGAMAVCAVVGHIQNGFFMNWFGAQQGEGLEYHILVVGIALALVFKGAGSFSIDGMLSGE